MPYLAMLKNADAAVGRAQVNSDGWNFRHCCCSADRCKISNNKFHDRKETAGKNPQTM